MKFNEFEHKAVKNCHLSNGLNVIFDHKWKKGTLNVHKNTQTAQPYTGSETLLHLIAIFQMRNSGNKYKTAYKRVVNHNN